MTAFSALLLVATLGSIALSGCTTSSEPDGQSGTGAVSRNLSVQEGGGYYHEPSRSGFLDEGIVAEALPYPLGQRRLRGKHGFALINTVTGAFLGVPDSSRLGRGSPSLSDPGESNALVRTYFESRGLPAGQVSDVHVTAMGVGEPGAPGTPEVRTFVAYYSHLQRSIKGIRVQESYAWARLDTNRRIVAEGVHWPTVPEDVVASANRLKLILGSPEALSQLLVRADVDIKGRELDSAEVVIHHSLGSWQGDGMQFAATLDLGSGLKSADKPTLRLNESGKRVVLEHSRWPAAFPVPVAKVLP